MSSETSQSPNLGTLTILPFEIRTQIYALVLDLFTKLHDQPQGDGPSTIPTIPPSRNRAALLLASKDIYKEAINILVNVNGFEIYIQRALYPDAHEGGQVTISDLLWTYSLRAQSRPYRRFRSPSFSLTTFTPQQQDAFIRCGLFKELRSVWLKIEGLQESDILPCEDDPHLKAKSSQFMELLSSIVQLLKGCSLKELDVTIEECAQVCCPAGDSEIPRHQQLARHTIGDLGMDTRGIQKVLDMIATLRGVEKCRIDAAGTDEDYNMGWHITPHYARHLRKIVQLPERVDAPAWVPDNKAIGPWQAYDQSYRFEVFGGDFEIGRPEDFGVFYHHE